MKFHHKGSGVCARYPTCVPDVIKMSQSICNMFPLRVSLSGGQSQAAAKVQIKMEKSFSAMLLSNFLNIPGDELFAK